MTQLKKLKKAVRARSQKTGESYTAARRQVLAAREKKSPSRRAAAPAAVAAAPQPMATASAPSPSAAPPALAKSAKVPAAAAPSTRGALSDKAAREKTGHGLDHWFAVLDDFRAGEKEHTDLAEHLYSVHGVPGWHAQGITVAYERVRGLRQVNQSCTGTFQVSVSKTVPAPVAEVADALRDAGRRAQWLAGADPGLAAALDAAFTGPKPREIKTKGSDYAWLRFPYDGPTVEIRITGKPRGASVVADNANLAEPALVEARRAQWKVALDGLLRHLSR
jgi:hypothetical protein